MPRPKRPGGEPADRPAVDVLVRIVQREFHDEKDTGFALLYDPAVVTDPVLARLGDQFWAEFERAGRGRDSLNPFTGELMPALHNEPWPEEPWMLTIAQRVSEPFVRRGALALLDVCGDQSRNVVFRLTTGELTRLERRGREELATHRLVLTGPRLAAATGLLLAGQAEELAQYYSAPAVYEVDLAPGTYRAVVARYDASSRATHDIVVQLLPEAADETEKNASSKRR